MLDNAEIGPRVALARRARGLTQLGLAQLLGTTAITVSRWERGVAGVRLERLREIALVCEVDLDWLETGVGTDQTAG